MKQICFGPDGVKVTETQVLIKQKKNKTKKPKPWRGKCPLLSAARATRYCRVDTEPLALVRFPDYFFLPHECLYCPVEDQMGRCHANFYFFFLFIWAMDRTALSRSSCGRWPREPWKCLSAPKAVIKANFSLHKNVSPPPFFLWLFVYHDDCDCKDIKRNTVHLLPEFNKFLYFIQVKRFRNV